MIELTENQIRDLVDYLTRAALNQLAMQKEFNFDVQDREKNISFGNCQYYRAGDIASIFGVSESAVYSWAKTGRIPEGVKVGGKRFWRKEDIDNFVKGLKCCSSRKVFA